jgi:hypothetical protein
MPFLSVLETTAQAMTRQFLHQVGIPPSLTGAIRVLGFTVLMIMVMVNTMVMERVTVMMRMAMITT